MGSLEPAMAAARFEDAVVEAVQARATGGLEATDGRRRWQFFFDEGRLVCTRSNLKGEQDAAIKEELGDLDSDAMARAQAVRRIKNACASEGLTWKFHQGVQPPHRRPAPIGPVLLEGLAQGRDPALLKQAIGSMWDGWPKVKGDLAALELEGEASDLLRSLDGTSRMEDALARARTRKIALAAMWMAVRFQLVEDAGPSDDVGDPVSDMDLDFDIGALIAEEVAQSDGEPSLQDLTPMPTPIQNDPVGKAGPSTPLPKPASGGLKSPPRSSTPPPAPVGNPQENRLKELDKQVYGADNYFQMFGLPWNAPTEQFRQRFMDFARELHPDKYNAAPDHVQRLATDLFDRIRGAWEIIEKEDERRKYTDRVIHGKQSDEEAAMEKVQRYYQAESEFKRGLAAFNNGRTNEAHTFFKSAVENSPDEFEFLLYYGYTLFFTSRTKDPHLAAQGIQLIQRVLKQNEKQDRKLDNGWVLLGRAWRDQGDFNEALRAFKTAVEINSANKEARRQYQRTREQMEGAETSSGFFSRFLGKDKR